MLDQRTAIHINGEEKTAKHTSHIKDKSNFIQITTFITRSKFRKNLQ